MKLTEIMTRFEVYDLQQSPRLRKLLKRLVKLHYRSRAADRANVSGYELGRLGRFHRLAKNAERLAWSKDRPAGRSTLVLMPGSHRIRLPAAKQGEHIAAFLRRVAGQFQYK